MSDLKDTKKSKSEEDKLKSFGEVIRFIIIGVIVPLVGVLFITFVIYIILNARNSWGIDDTLFTLQIIGSIVFLIIRLIIVFWIYNATLEKGMPSPPTWSLMALFFTFITLIIYFYNKPEGELVICQICEKKKLDILYECPHCKVRKENLPKRKTRRT